MVLFCVFLVFCAIHQYGAQFSGIPYDTASQELYPEMTAKTGRTAA